MRRGARSTPRGSRDHPAGLPHSRLQRPQAPLAAFSLVRERRSRGQLGYLRLLWTHSGQGTPRGRLEDATKFAPSCLQPSKVHPNVGCVLIGVVTAKMDTTRSSRASHEKTRAWSPWEGVRSPGIFIESDARSVPPAPSGPPGPSLRHRSLWRQPPPEPYMRLRRPFSALVACPCGLASSTNRSTCSAVH